MNNNILAKNQLLLTIPTYRLLEALEVAQRYVSNFVHFKHQVPIIIFDDTETQSSARSFLTKEKINYPPGLFYVGTNEKAEVLEALVRETKIEKGLLKSIFRPSYGGNRNFTLIYTIGHKFVTVDDDIYPYSLLTDHCCLKDNEVAKGRFLEPEKEQILSRPEDVITAFKQFLGTKVGEHQCLKGDYIEDDAMDLFTNISKGVFSSNVLKLVSGTVASNSEIKHCQTYRSGSPDIDTKDYIEEFLLNPHRVLKNDLPKTYVLSAYKPCITGCNWQVDSAVSAFDNRIGLPPFIPTSLRFEDYIFRLWLQWDKVASAHVDAAQTHKRSTTNRPPLAEDYLNEELTKILKTKLKQSIKSISDVSIDFSDINVSSTEIIEALDNAKQIYSQAKQIIAKKSINCHYLRQFCNLLEETFYDFDQQEFLSEIDQRLKDEFLLLRKTMNVWPEIIEAAKKINLKIRRIK